MHDDVAHISPTRSLWVSDGEQRRCRLRAFRLLTRAFAPSESGVSAVEFGLIAAILLPALLSVVDLGLAARERMTIDHALRSGAQHAMADPGVADTLKLTQATAVKHFTLATGEVQDATALKLNVTRFCACPGNSSTPVACSTTCGSVGHTFIYYRLSGEKTYSGFLLPPIQLRPTAQVQIR